MTSDALDRAYDDGVADARARLAEHEDHESARRLLAEVRCSRESCRPGTEGWMHLVGMSVYILRLYPDLQQR
jgi:hypothetical protein